MGDNVPKLGELVAYYVDAKGPPTMATVVGVTFWDLVDLELATGVVLRNVRREVILADGEIVARAGRFVRLVA